MQDLLARFHGSWDLRPKRDADGNIVGCHAVLKQDVLPKGEHSRFLCVQLASFVMCSSVSCMLLVHNALSTITGCRITTPFLSLCGFEGSEALNVG